MLKKERLYFTVNKYREHTKMHFAEGMRPNCGHFQLHKQVWPLGQLEIVSSGEQLQIAKNVISISRIKFKMQQCKGDNHLSL
jgi:hypothetical protein